ncbi:hypothetical protein PPERSA_07926 [Pseudocohnilembus persalinus]|uniref:Uncharacterized protein n=1 Tax=Pseudocohnilembus persalinus TaxID=266149 RepID=A0A0V0QWW9_PSEPJ|nr:hypothetical protein PPERSA_07926 [Pseudocohnilembus persalinus]|eukprot:KRX06692.1 hypothetical protein PPERSA_07926 [Pseudocohnilembus persalinus]
MGNQHSIDVQNLDPQIRQSLNQLNENLENLSNINTVLQQSGQQHGIQTHLMESDFIQKTMIPGNYQIQNNQKDMLYSKSSYNSNNQSNIERKKTPLKQSQVSINPEKLSHFKSKQHHTPRNNYNNGQQQQFNFEQQNEDKENFNNQNLASTQRTNNHHGPHLKNSIFVPQKINRPVQQDHQQEEPQQNCQQQPRFTSQKVLNFENHLKTQQNTLPTQPDDLSYRFKTQQVSPSSVMPSKSPLQRIQQNHQQNNSNFYSTQNNTKNQNNNNINVNNLQNLNTNRSHTPIQHQKNFSIHKLAPKSPNGLTPNHQKQNTVTVINNFYTPRAGNVPNHNKHQSLAFNRTLQFGQNNQQNFNSQCQSKQVVPEKSSPLKTYFQQYNKLPNKSYIQTEASTPNHRNHQILHQTYRQNQRVTPDSKILQKNNSVFNFGNFNQDNQKYQNSSQIKNSFQQSKDLYNYTVTPGEKVNTQNQYTGNNFDDTQKTSNNSVYNSNNQFTTFATYLNTTNKTLNNELNPENYHKNNAKQSQSPVNNNSIQQQQIQSQQLQQSQQFKQQQQSQISNKLKSIVGVRKASEDRFHSQNISAVVVNGNNNYENSISIYNSNYYQNQNQNQKFNSQIYSYNPKEQIQTENICSRTSRAQTQQQIINYQDMQQEKQDNPNSSQLIQQCQSQYIQQTETEINYSSIQNTNSQFNQLSQLRKSQSQGLLNLKTNEIVEEKQYQFQNQYQQQQQQQAPQIIVNNTEQPLKNTYKPKSPFVKINRVIQPLHAVTPSNLHYKNKSLAEENTPKYSHKRQFTEQEQPKFLFNNNSSVKKNEQFATPREQHSINNSTSRSLFKDQVDQGKKIIEKSPYKINKPESISKAQIYMTSNQKYHSQVLENKIKDDHKFQSQVISNNRNNDKNQSQEINININQLLENKNNNGDLKNIIEDLKHKIVQDFQNLQCKIIDTNSVSGSNVLELKNLIGESKPGSQANISSTKNGSKEITYSVNSSIQESSQVQNENQSQENQFQVKQVEILEHQFKKNLRKNKKFRFSFADPNCQQQEEYSDSSSEKDEKQQQQLQDQDKKVQNQDQQQNQQVLRIHLPENLSIQLSQQGIVNGGTSRDLNNVFNKLAGTQNNILSPQKKELGQLNEENQKIREQFTPSDKKIGEDYKGMTPSFQTFTNQNLQRKSQQQQKTNNENENENLEGTTKKNKLQGKNIDFEDQKCFEYEEDEENQNCKESDEKKSLQRKLVESIYRMAYNDSQQENLQQNKQIIMDQSNGSIQESGDENNCDQNDEQKHHNKRKFSGSQLQQRLVTIHEQDDMDVVRVDTLMEQASPNKVEDEEEQQNLEKFLQISDKKESQDDPESMVRIENSSNEKEQNKSDQKDYETENQQQEKKIDQNQSQNNIKDTQINNSKHQVQNSSHNSSKSSENNKINNQNSKNSLNMNNINNLKDSQQSSQLPLSQRNQVPSLPPMPQSGNQFKKSYDQVVGSPNQTNIINNNYNNSSQQPSLNRASSTQLRSQQNNNNNQNYQQMVKQQSLNNQNSLQLSSYKEQNQFNSVNLSYLLNMDTEQTGQKGFSNTITQSDFKKQLQNAEDNFSAKNLQNEFENQKGRISEYVIYSNKKSGNQIQLEQLNNNAVVNNYPTINENVHENSGEQTERNISEKTQKCSNNNTNNNTISKRISFSNELMAIKHQQKNNSQCEENQEKSLNITENANYKTLLKQEQNQQAEDMDNLNNSIIQGKTNLDRKFRSLSQTMEELKNRSASRTPNSKSPNKLLQSQVQNHHSLQIQQCNSFRILNNTKNNNNQNSQNNINTNNFSQLSEKPDYQANQKSQEINYQQQQYMQNSKRNSQQQNKENIPKQQQQNIQTLISNTHSVYESFNNQSQQAVIQKSQDLEKNDDKNQLQQSLQSQRQSQQQIQLNNSISIQNKQGKNQLRDSKRDSQNKILESIRGSSSQNLFSQLLKKQQEIDGNSQQNNVQISQSKVEVQKSNKQLEISQRIILESKENENENKIKKSPEFQQRLDEDNDTLQQQQNIQVQSFQQSQQQEQKQQQKSSNDFEQNFFSNRDKSADKGIVRENQERRNKNYSMNDNLFTPRSPIGLVSNRSRNESRSPYGSSSRYPSNRSRKNINFLY